MPTSQDCVKRVVHFHGLEKSRPGRVLGCSVCAKPHSPTSHQCASCPFVICGDCYPQPARHPLHCHEVVVFRVTSQNPSLGECSICGYNLQLGTTASACAKGCNFSLCHTCYMEKPYTELQPTLRAVQIHDHFLEHCRWADQCYQHGYHCNKCWKDGDSTRWACRECGFDLCELCCSEEVVSQVPKFSHASANLLSEDPPILLLQLRK